MFEECEGNYSKSSEIIVSQLVPIPLTRKKFLFLFSYFHLNIQSVSCLVKEIIHKENYENKGESKSINGNRMNLVNQNL